MIACGKQLGEKENVSKSIIAFVMNSIALGMSVVMLLGGNSMATLLKLELLHYLLFIYLSTVRY